MEYLFISTNDAVPWGGSEELWSGAAARLAGEGHRVTASVWDHSPEPAVLGSLRTGGVLVHKRHERRIQRNRLQQAWATVLQGAPPMVRSNELELLQGTKADLVVFSVGYQLCPKFLRMSKVLRDRKQAYAVVVQLVIEGLPMNDDMTQAYLDAYEGAARVWFVSEQNRQATERELGYVFTRASIVHNPVDTTTEVLDPPPTEGGWSLAMVGALSPHHKGQDLVIALLARPKWRERPLQVSFFGQGASRATLERAVRVHDLRNVAFRGHVPDKAAIWSTHHAALFASRMEGRSLALQEAMAHGRMVISTDVGGARDLITDGIDGYLISAPTVDALDEALERAWQAREQWAAMGLRAHERLLGWVPSDPLGYFANAVSRTVTDG
ncbi:MAG TPA: glycosyltransferase family 4 protein [Flavobacteriales bacterium]|nr:glycosyltransferase family 4 protein [Flavobacteriales bacterium]